MSAAGDPSSTPSRRSPWLAPLRVVEAHKRLFLCGLIGALIGVCLPETTAEPPQWLSYLPLELRPVTRALIGWDAAVVLYVVLMWRLVAGSTHETIRRRAQVTDEGRATMLILTAAAACVSLGAIVFELGPVKSMQGWEKAAHVVLAAVTVVASWIFMHLAFAFHYAHEYYSEEASHPGKSVQTRGGLIFPGAHTPHYLDFLYFSFVIGVACQTADVSTTSPAMRWLALVQGVVAFFFNVAILALMVNIASGLM